MATLKERVDKSSHLNQDMNLNLNVQGRSTGGRGTSATAHEPEDYDSVQLPNVNIAFNF